jgi:hypothetical protein
LIEKDIENLLANYPDEFFPKAGFVLQGQQVRIGNCRADILFKDKYDRAIIIEVKKGLLSRDASGQVLEYYGLLKQDSPDKIIELILCANVIPTERRTFLENSGIECKELGVGLITNIAIKYGYTFLDEGKNEQTKNIAINEFNKHENSPFMSETNGNVWIFQANRDRFDILNALSDTSYDKDTWLINQHKNEIKKGDIALIWMSGANDGGIYAVADILTDPILMNDNPHNEKYWMNEKDRGQSKLRVNMKVVRRFLNYPVFRKDLVKIEGLNNLSILRYSQGTNFPVNKNEWQIIKQQIENR